MSYIHFLSKIFLWQNGLEAFLFLCDEMLQADIKNGFFSEIFEKNSTKKPY